MSRVGAVAIGRNEGERLKRCLTSLLSQVDRAVYVDSGSKDDSVAFAKGLGIDVVVLDNNAPFTAARGRNAGFDALISRGHCDYIQFVDGDCAVEPGWIEAARTMLDADPSIGLVTGWRTELEPRRNIFHAMCEVEWHRPSGDVAVCGGDMMVRADAFRAAGGFNPGLIASEDEEFCLRLAARTGLRVHRIPRLMTRHDIRMSHLGEWWRRHLRAGHGYAEVGGLYPGHFRRERLRAWFYGLLMPLLAIFGAVTGHWWLVGVVTLGYGANWLRTAHGLRAGGHGWNAALHQAAYLSLSKLPALQGILLYYMRRFQGEPMHIIEYK